MRRQTATILLILSALSAATNAYAYIGPGAGLSAIGSALALVGAVFLMLVGFVWYPVKRLMRGRKTAGASEPQEPESPNHAERDRVKSERTDASGPGRRPDPSSKRT